MRIFAVPSLLLLATSAAAEPPAEAPAVAPAPRIYEVGARIGGYGFRREAGQAWDECPMGGFGVFGTRAMRGPLFAEAGIDLYSSGERTHPEDLPIDRTSGLFSGAIGARTNVTSWLRGYLQLGGGLEVARVSVPYGDKRIRDTLVMPEAFVGIGLDLKIWRQTYFGTSFRALVMGNFEYDPARLDPDNMWVAQPTADTVFAVSPDVATQVQFSLRREL